MRSIDLPFKLEGSPTLRVWCAARRHFRPLMASPEDDYVRDINWGELCLLSSDEEAGEPSVDIDELYDVVTGNTWSSVLLEGPTT